MKSLLEPSQQTFSAPNAFIALEPKTSPIVSSASSAVRLAPPIMSEDDASADNFVVMALMLTRRCNMSCAHCSVESGPRVEGQPDDEELLQSVRDAIRLGISTIQLTGGEPMLREDLVMRLLAEIKALGAYATLSSNGFWGKNAAVAAQKVRALSEAGVGRLTISYDRYHAEFQGSEPAVNIARAVEENDLSMQMSINFTRQMGDSLSDLVAPFEGFSKAQMRFYDVQAVGRARDFAPATLRAECEGFCTACCVSTLTDDGRMTACNGPSYFSDASSPLVVGSLHEYSFGELMKKHRHDPILETIRTFGPSRLRRELEQMPESGVELRDSYSGMCDLCLHMTSQPQAMAAVRERLSQPRALAERAAAQRVMKDARSCEGELNRDHINGSGACGVWLRAMTEPAAKWAHKAERVMGRADFDWHAQMLHLSQCGAAGALQNALREPALARWAPQFFVQGLQKTAQTDALRTMLQREALRELAHIARDLGVKIVLFKGAAILAQAHEDRVLDVARHTPARSCGDIDVWISPDDAPRVRDEMLRRGFCDPLDGKWRNNTKSLDQLEALSFRGVSIEIHQRLIAGYFDLPEREMWSSTQSLSHVDWRGLSVMSPEANLIFSVMHTAKHLWTHGLKTTLDILWITERAPAFSWTQVARWIAPCKMKRGFMATVVALEELSPGFSAEVLALAPRDALQKKLEDLARRHVFGVRPAANEQEEDGRRRVLLTLMSDSRSLQLRCAASILIGKTRLRSLPHRNRNLAARAREVHRAWRGWHR